MKEKDDNALEELLSVAKEIDGKKIIDCAAAFTLAEKHGLTRKAMGELCNQAKVKIVSCQLGCF